MAWLLLVLVFEIALEKLFSKSLPSCNIYKMQASYSEDM
jgi:hypothetical protein